MIHVPYRMCERLQHTATRCNKDTATHDMCHVAAPMIHVPYLMCERLLGQFGDKSFLLVEDRALFVESGAFLVENEALLVVMVEAFLRKHCHE